jgi:hypothetical protein
MAVRMFETAAELVFITKQSCWDNKFWAINQRN